ncbi:MAG: electron transport complex subunit RsxC [Oscillospiraceae bacterium]|nr:electron transport complex subunit RsxC [Oscillospiraceae bacterium]
MNLKSILAPAARVPGGLRLPGRKDTAGCETLRMPPPARVVIPMCHHIGVPAVPAVKKGDTVSVGQVIGDIAGSCDDIGIPVHASVSGTVRDIVTLTMPDGARSEAVVIDSDGLMTPFSGIQPPKIETAEELLAAAGASGLAGLGGAGFPAYAKLKPKKDTVIDTLIVNAAECEPYITVDHRACIEQTADIFEGVEILQRRLNIPAAVIAAESNAPQAIAALNQVAGENVSVMKLPARYPQGAEKTLVYAVTKRKIPAGGLPADVGCLVMNVSSVAFLARYLRTGKPLVSRTVTLAGPAIANPGNYRVPVGTSVADLIAFAGSYAAPARKLLIGGPMMGTALASENTPILRYHNAVLAFTADTAVPPPQKDCIRCGRCLLACPMKLAPVTLKNAVKTNDLDTLRKFDVSSCYECGCCAYVCPAGIPLVQQMRLGKAQLKIDN